MLFLLPRWHLASNVSAFADENVVTETIDEWFEAISEKYEAVFHSGLTSKLLLAKKYFNF